MKVRFPFDSFRTIANRRIAAVVSRLSALAALAVCAGAASAATTDCSLTLKKGWNAVYVPVAAEGEADEIFAEWPVPSVSLYRSSALLDTQSTAGGVTGETVTRQPFFIWTRDSAESSDLQSLPGDAVLVCCNTGAAERVVHLRGTPVAPRIAWHLSTSDGDTLNYVGIGLNPGASVNASAYFAGCPSVRGGQFYRLSGTEAAPKVVSLAGFSSTSSAKLTDGMAVLIPGAAVSDWSGPLHVTPRKGIDFGESRTIDEIRIRNDGVAEKRVSVALLHSSGNVPPIEIMQRDADGEIVNKPWTVMSPGVGALEKNLATGETWRISVALDRTKLSGTGKTLGAILCISEIGGTQMRANIPVTARDAKTADAWPCGLWAADLELDSVSRYVTDDMRVDGVKAGGKMKLRLYVHVAADSTVRLLPRVVLAGAKKEDGTIAGIAYGPLAAIPSGVDYARRLTSAALPVDIGAVTPEGGAKWGEPLSFKYTIAANSPSNPFRHSLHPMFDGKDSRFDPLPYDGDDFSNYANAVKPELFSLGGEVALQFAETDGTAWSPQETVSGTCSWIYTGLMRQGPVKATGTFTAHRSIPGILLQE